MSNYTSEEEEFFEDLIIEIDNQEIEILKAEYPLIAEGKVEPEQWCQDMMVLKLIPQERAAEFLKAEHNIDVVLLPEQEFTLHISDSKHYN